MNLIFVYGTLKRGHGNFHHFLEDKSKFLGEYVTPPQFKMISLGGFPGVLLNGSNAITGELFEIDDVQFKRIDRLEGYPNFYNRVQIETPKGPAWMYHLEGQRYGRYTEVEGGCW